MASSEKFGENSPNPKKRALTQERRTPWSLSSGARQRQQRKRVQAAEQEATVQVNCPVCAISMRQDAVFRHLDACAGSSATASEARSRHAFMSSFSRLAKAPITITAKDASKQRAVEVGPEELLAQPVRVLSDVLPAAMADALARLLDADAQARWTSSSWTVFDNEGGTNRLSAVYRFDPSTPVPDATARGGDFFTTLDDTPALLREAAEKVREVVQRLRPEGEAEAAWRPTFVLGNYYRDGADSIAFHGDSLTSLGPQAVVAALSLGSTRLFRWHCVEGEKRTYTARLSHNSALIMLPPCQELGKHGVPKQSNESIAAHPITGLKRISLTFRMHRPEIFDAAPRCECERTCTLKFSPKARRYFWKCDPHGAGAKTCNFFQVWWERFHAQSSASSSSASSSASSSSSSASLTSSVAAL